MLIDDLINNNALASENLNSCEIISLKNLQQKDCNNKNIELVQFVFQESEPYSIDKTIIGTNVYIWNKNFIDRVIESFRTTIVQNFSKKEKDLFNRYTSFLINGLSSVIDEDVRELDEYLGSIKGSI